jgi:hypothetical protein
MVDNRRDAAHVRQDYYLSPFKIKFLIYKKKLKIVIEL